MANKLFYYDIHDLKKEYGGCWEELKKYCSDGYHNGELVYIDPERLDEKEEIFSKKDMFPMLRKIFADLNEGASVVSILYWW